MAGDGWTYAIDDAALADGAIQGVRPDGVAVLLARVDGAVYAISDRCVHLGCLLSKGKLDGYTVTCPCHDWRFDVRTGRFLDAPELGQAVYPVKSDGGKLFVSLPQKGETP
jgi:3-phenylpropionate/trans-cinnamate dioxygenase ferredoxin subunit